MNNSDTHLIKGYLAIILSTQEAINANQYIQMVLIGVAIGHFIAALILSFKD